MINPLILWSRKYVCFPISHHNKRNNNLKSIAHQLTKLQPIRVNPDWCQPNLIVTIDIQLFDSYSIAYTPIQKSYVIRSYYETNHAIRTVQLNYRIHFNFPSAAVSFYNIYHYMLMNQMSANGMRFI